MLTAVNGAELSKCALTVSQLAVLLKARPLKLSFMEGSPSLNSRLSAAAHYVLVQFLVTGSPQVSGTSAHW